MKKGDTKMKIKLNVVLTIAAIPLFIVGLGMTFATSAMLGSFIGIDANLASIHMARALGTAFIGIAVMIFLARNSGPSQARNALVAGLSLFFLLAAITDARAILAGTLAPSGWFSGVGLWLLFFILIVLAGRNAMAEEK
jgi:hypothetical protein